MAGRGLGSAGPGERAPGLPSAAWRAGALASVVGLAAAMALSPGSPGWLVITKAVSLAGVSVVAVAATRMPAPARPAWWWLFAFQSLTWIGDLMYDTHAYAGSEPVLPDLSTQAYLLGYLAAFIGLGTIIRGRGAAGGRQSATALAVSVVASVALLATFVVAPSMVSAGPGGPLPWDAVLYPLLDVALLTMLLRLALDLTRWDLPLLLIGAALLAFLAADLAYNVQLLHVSDSPLPPWLETLFLAPFLLLALAATAPGAGKVAKPVTAPPSAVAASTALTVGALLTPGLLLLLAWQRGETLLAILATLAVTVTGVVLWQIRSLVDTVARSEEHYRLLLENTGDVVMLFDGGRIRWASPSVMDMLGWMPEELVGRTQEDLVHPDDLPGTDAASTRDGGLPTRFRVRTADGSYLWAAATLRSAHDGTGRNVGQVASLRDIHAEVAAAEALARSEAQFRLAMAAAPTGIAVVDSDMRFVDVNDALCRTLHREREWLVGRGIDCVVDPDSVPVLEQLRHTVALEDCTSARGDLLLVTAGGRRRTVECSIAQIVTGDSDAVSYVYQVVDVTDAREALEGLEFLASHDPLTMLANRNQLLGSARGALRARQLNGSRVGLMFIDVDGLKRVNDTYGHALGDRLILSVADSIRSVTRQEDVTARVGGDEFVVLLRGVHHVNDALSAAAKIHRAMETTIAFHAEGVAHHPMVSIGVALAEPDDEPDNLLRRADQAMYRAKRTGPGRTAAAESAATTDRGAGAGRIGAGAVVVDKGEDND